MLCGDVCNFSCYVLMFVMVFYVVCKPLDDNLNNTRSATKIAPGSQSWLFRTHVCYHVVSFCFFILEHETITIYSLLKLCGRPCISYLWSKYSFLYSNTYFSEISAIFYGNNQSICLIFFRQQTNTDFYI